MTTENHITNHMMSDARVWKQYALVSAFRGKEPRECVQIVKNVVIDTIDIRQGMDEPLRGLLELYNVISQYGESGVTKEERFLGLKEIQAKAMLSMYSCNSRINMPFPEFQGRLLELLRYGSDLYGVLVVMLSFDIRPNQSEINGYYKEKIRIFCEGLQTMPVCDELLDKLMVSPGHNMSLHGYMIRCISTARVRKAPVPILIQEALVRRQNKSALL